jgi:hypothetical protein
VLFKLFKTLVEVDIIVLLVAGLVLWRNVIQKLHQMLEFGFQLMLLVVELLDVLVGFFN